MTQKAKQSIQIPRPRFFRSCCSALTSTANQSGQVPRSMSVVMGGDPNRKTRRLVHAALARLRSGAEDRTSTAKPRAPPPKPQLSSRTRPKARAAHAPEALWAHTHGAVSQSYPAILFDADSNPNHMVSRQETVQPIRRLMNPVKRERLPYETWNDFI
jgi:hypothetical protein